MVSRLFLVRHGETEWSRSGQHTGRSDIPLTTGGEDEASNLAASLKTIPFAHVLTSPQQRARRTCELAGLGSAAIVEPDLAEWDYGNYEGRRSVDIRKERPGWNIFRDGCPGGETTAQFSIVPIGLFSVLVDWTTTSRFFSMGNSGVSWPRDGLVDR
jgi:broad specificity phosphatase PhoE